MPLNSAGVILAAVHESETLIRLESAAKSLGFVIEPACDPTEVASLLRQYEGKIAVVVLDCAGPGGIEQIREIRAADPYLPVVVISHGFSTSDVVLAMRYGAADFLPKPVEVCDLAVALKRALETRDAGVSKNSQNGAAPAYFTGLNRRMARIHALACQMGQSDIPVLILGETGSGKEVIARAIHNQSRRANKIFLKLNCAALPSELLESELFGYERGAFTGAYRKKAGVFELANGGTLLLDEIGDMDLRLQAKLLQVLQDQEFRRVGGMETVQVDVRIIAATHCDLEKAIHERSFREDLYYRLNVVKIQVPPLRERKEDIMPIAEFLIGRHAEKEDGDLVDIISTDLKQAMLAYDWPGNVRELENCMRRLLIFGDPGDIAREIRARTPGHCPIPIRAPEPREEEKTVSVLEQATREKARVEMDAILAALAKTGWNRKQAAQILKVDYKSLLYKMKKLGIDNHVFAKRTTAGGQYR